MFLNLFEQYSKDSISHMYLIVSYENILSIKHNSNLHFKKYNNINSRKQAYFCDIPKIHIK